MRNTMLTILTLLVASLTHGAGFDEGYESYKAGDYAGAMQVLRPLAKRGNSHAQLLMGMMVDDSGEGVIQHHWEAVKWYGRAAQQGLLLAKLFLMDGYESSGSIVNDIKESLEPHSLVEGIEGVSWARGQAAYDRGDFLIARLEFTLLAYRGYAPAQLFLGMMYDFGQGVVEDEKKAVTWYRLAVANPTVLGLGASP